MTADSDPPDYEQSLAESARRQPRLMEGIITLTRDLAARQAQEADAFRARYALAQQELSSWRDAVLAPVFADEHLNRELSELIDRIGAARASGTLQDLNPPQHLRAILEPIAAREHTLNESFSREAAALEQRWQAEVTRLAGLRADEESVLERWRFEHLERYSRDPAVARAMQELMRRVETAVTQGAEAKPIVPE